ncbi:MAG: glycoside hydrolase family 127 protein [Acidimicrobiales bacterium]
MDQGSDSVPHSPAQPSPTPVGHGPVWPTSAALGRLWPLGLHEVALDERSALGELQHRNSTKTIPHLVEQVVASGALRNLQRVAEGAHDKRPHEGMHFSDSDVYKVLEAAAWDSIRGVSAEVADFVEEATAVIQRAQREDGYLNSWFQGQHPELIWKDLRWGHELYCAGHLLQAAVATQRTGGGRGLFAVSSKLVDHLLRTFSLDDGDGGLVGVCGHPLVETALVEFYRLTGDKALLNLAERQVDLRGRPDVELPSSGLLGDSRFPLSYFLHHAPVRKRSLATGHAVRELYLQTGVVDVATETADEELLKASEAIWDDLYGTKTYLTGGHGSRHRDESIGDAYELPSDRAYAETCAAIGSFQWNWRLLLATGRARYAQAMEHVLWNTIAGAVSREGTEFFYSNTLHLRTDHGTTDEDSPRHRLPWYQCACCPPNLGRVLASIQSYLVTRDSSGLQVHMPFGGNVQTRVPGGTVELAVRTEHPWKATIGLEVTRCSCPGPWALYVRLPEGASKQGTKLTVNGRLVPVPWDGDYVKITRQWRAGDCVDLYSSTPVRLITPHWKIDAARGCVALQRGPLVYCAEAADLEQGTTVEDIALDDSHQPVPTANVPKQLEGYVKVALHASGRRVDSLSPQLYDGRAASGLSSEPHDLTLIPYFARGNRPLSAMRVWVPVLRPEGPS